MRYWDASAVVPLCVLEPATLQVRRLTDEDPAIVVWWTTRTECISALARRRREAGIDARTEERARRILSSLAETWSEVVPAEAVRERAERILGVHPLRASDAFQLAAALTWSRERTRSHGFVCFDERLRAAAGREGFVVLPA